jgi:hypothetical protein
MRQARMRPAARAVPTAVQRLLMALPPAAGADQYEAVASAYRSDPILRWQKPAVRECLRQWPKIGQEQLRCPDDDFLPQASGIETPTRAELAPANPFRGEGCL